MSNVLRTSSNYKIKTSPSGEVILDTPTVRVTGNLIVEGDTTDVQVANLKIEDNLITVNNNETGAGVTLGFAGIEVDRGTSFNSAFIYNETSDAWEIVKNVSGNPLNWEPSFSTSKIKIRQILTDNVVDSGDLTLLGNYTGLIKVFSQAIPNSYTEQIVSRNLEDALVNKGYVDYAIINRPRDNEIGSGDTILLAKDKDVFNDAVNASVINVRIDGDEVAAFYANRIEFNQLEFKDNSIINTVSSQNLVLATNGTGKVEINYAFQMDYTLDSLDQYSDTVNSAAVVYGNTPGIGDTGVYVLNRALQEDSTLIAKHDELISKNKALIFSMLF